MATSSRLIAVLITPHAATTAPRSGRRSAHGRDLHARARLGTTCYAIALIGNLHGFGDRKLEHYADYPGRGGWRRVSRDDPSYDSFSSEGTTLLAFHYVPKTMRQGKRVGWVYLPAGLFVLFFGVLTTIAGVTGNVE